MIAWNTTVDGSWATCRECRCHSAGAPVVRATSRYEEPAAWRTVGQVLDLTSGTLVAGGRRDRVALTPSGRRISLTPGTGPEFLELEEQGFYELRSSGASETRPR